MGVASQVRKALKMQLLSLFPLFGFGLLGGDSANTTTTSLPASTSTTTASPATTTTALVEALTSTTTNTDNSDNSGIIQNLVDVLTGKVATIALDQLSSLLGLNNPVPSPLSDPIGFLTHPLISHIILAAVTLNPPAIALAMGGLAGNLVLTHIFTIATEAVAAAQARKSNFIESTRCGDARQYLWFPIIQLICQPCPVST